MRYFMTIMLLLNSFLAGEVVSVIHNPYGSLTHQVALLLQSDTCATDAECGCTDGCLQLAEAK